MKGFISMNRITYFIIIGCVAYYASTQSAAIPTQDKRLLPDSKTISKATAEAYLAPHDRYDIICKLSETVVHSIITNTTQNPCDQIHFLKTIKKEIQFLARENFNYVVQDSKIKTMSPQEKDDNNKKMNANLKILKIIQQIDALIKEKEDALHEHKKNAVVAQLLSKL